MYYQFTASAGASAAAFSAALPPGTKAIYLQPSASGVQFEFGTPTGPTFLTTAARGAFLDGPNLVNGPFRVINSGPSGLRAVVGIFNGQGSAVTVNVYTAPTS